MRKTSETPDNVTMSMCISGVFRVAQSFDQPHGFILRRDIFGMFKGQIEKRSFVFSEIAIPAFGYGRLGQLQCFPVRCESPRVVAEYVRGT